jgi:tyrosyl-tRNA synthetase
VDEFFRIHGAGKTGVPDEIEDVRVPADLVQNGVISAADLAICCGFAKSKGEARRLIAENGVRLEGEPLSDPQGSVSIKTGQVVQRGKRRFVRLVVE